jgi:hypothetical protein
MDNNQRVAIRSIVFPLADFPAPLLTSRPFTSWADAETAILGTVKSKPHVAGRIAFELTWADEETYQAQLPLTTTLAPHVRQALEFHAGRRPAWAARILDTHEIGGAS